MLFLNKNNEEIFLSQMFKRSFFIRKLSRNYNDTPFNHHVYCYSLYSNASKLLTVDCWLFRDLDEALEMGMDWSLREGYVWAEDKVTGWYFISLKNNFLNRTRWSRYFPSFGYVPDLPLWIFGDILMDFKKSLRIQLFLSFH